jgi:hypothetical protein
VSALVEWACEHGHFVRAEFVGWPIDAVKEYASTPGTTCGYCGGRMHAHMLGESERFADATRPEPSI